MSKESQYERVRTSPYDLMRIAAYQKKGAEHHNTIIFFESVVAALPWVFAAAVIGAFGWLAHHLWVSVHVGLPVMAHMIGSHRWVWVLLAAWLVGFFRARAMPSYSPTRKWLIGFFLLCAVLAVWRVLALFA